MLYLQERKFKTHYIKNKIDANIKSKNSLHLCVAFAKILDLIIHHRVNDFSKEITGFGSDQGERDFSK